MLRRRHGLKTWPSPAQQRSWLYPKVIFATSAMLSLGTYLNKKLKWHAAPVRQLPSTGHAGHAALDFPDDQRVPLLNKREPTFNQG